LAQIVENTVIHVVFINLQDALEIKEKLTFSAFFHSAPYRGTHPFSPAKAHQKHICQQDWILADLVCQPFR